jgi:NADPH:quinone reductase-like Zn-dependent oxidoreductase
VPDPVPGAGEELIEVTAAPVNNIDKVRADGTHYSVTARPQKGGSGGNGGSSPLASTDLPRVTGVVGAGRRPGGQRVLFGSEGGTMAQYATARPEYTFPVPDGLDDAAAAAAWNPGLSAWLLFGWRASPGGGSIAMGATVLVLGATGVTGRMAVQAARRYGAGRVVAAGRNPASLAALPALGADAVISLDQPDADLSAALAAEAGAAGYDVVADYLWGRPTEIFIDSLIKEDLEVRTLRTRLVQAGEMVGSTITLPASALRSAGLEVLGMGTGTMPPRELIGELLSDLMDRLASGEVRIDIERVPLADVAAVWSADQPGRRPVLIP